MVTMLPRPPALGPNSYMQPIPNPPLYDIERINERISALIDHLAPSQRKFAEIVDESAPNVNHYSKERMPPSSFIAKIAAYYPQVNLRWLLLGEGEMFIRQEEEIAQAQTGVLRALAAFFGGQELPEGVELNVKVRREGGRRYFEASGHLSD